MSEKTTVKKIRNNPKTPRIYEPVANVWELCAHINGHGERQLFLWKDPISGEDRSMTYGELHNRIHAVAAAIDHAGLRGSRIAVTGPNSPMLSIPGVIFSESSLTYLGIVNLESSTQTSVGTLLSKGNGVLKEYPHIILFPALFISLLEISFNLFGNGLRDAFNPSLKGIED